MNRFSTVLLGAVTSLVLGCGVGVSDDAARSSQALQGVDDNGTVLTVVPSATVVSCTAAGTANVAFSGTLSTNGSVDSVEVTASVDGAAPVLLQTIQPQDFTHDGRTKTAPYAASLSLTNGSYATELCFTQSGAQGRTPKKVCAPSETVTVACVATCADVEPFGNLVGNPSLCKGNGPPNIPVHVRGDFGDAATLTISGPNGFTHAAAMRHAGDSCNYQYNWANTSDGGAGTYAFTVEGNGRQLVFSADLHCAN